MQEYKKAVDIIHSHSEYLLNNADICEVAHQYTEIECIGKGIKIDDDWEGCETYTPEAQRIFDKHYTLITETLCV